MALRQKGESKRVSKTLTVLNPLGLHVRPAAQFVRCVQQYRSEVILISNDTRYEAGRLMDILMANLDLGAVFTIEADGPDAELVVQSLEHLLVELQREEEAEGKS